MYDMEVTVSMARTETCLYTCGHNLEGGLGVPYPFFPSTRGGDSPVDQWTRVAALTGCLAKATYMRICVALYACLARWILY